MGRPSHFFDKKVFFYLVEIQDKLAVKNQRTVRESRECTAAVFNLNLDQLEGIERRGIAMGWLEQFDKKQAAQAAAPDLSKPWRELEEAS